MMMDHLSLFASDADQWEADGMTHEDEDALVLALWRWYRGRPSADGLPVVAKVLYSSITRQKEAHERIYATRSVAGRKGASVRWNRDFANGKTNGKTIEKPMAKLWPTATATATATASVSVESGGTGADANKPPAPTRERFAKPSADEIRAYCDAQGFSDVNAEKFVDYYESNGWIVGKSKMRDWKATVRNWHRRASDDFGKAVDRSHGVGIRHMSRSEDDYGL